LEDLAEALSSETDPKGLRAAALTVDSVLAEEGADWFGAMRAHEPEFTG
jgi:hypothetical protein